MRIRPPAGRIGAGGLLLLVAMLGLGGCTSTAMQLRNSGLALYARGQYRQAHNKFQQALAETPTDPRANYYLASTDYRLHRYEQAAYHYKLAWTQDPAFPHIASATADALIHAGKANEAMNFLERDAALTHSVRARLRVAHFYQRLGDMDNARANFLRATKIAPNNPRVFIDLGNFYQSIGRRHSAGMAYAAAYDINPLLPGLVAKMQSDGVMLSQAVGAGPAAAQGGAAPPTGPTP